MIRNLHRILFSLVVVVLPINLGIHFLSVGSFVNSRLVDYLIPTIWLQDILILLLIIFWFFDKGFSDLGQNGKLRFTLLFLVSVLPSVLVAPNIKASISFLFHLYIYVFFAIYVSKNVYDISNFKKILKLLSIGVIFLFIISVGQWVKQGSLFNNYLFFGEQPYDTSTFGIARTDFFGSLKIPSYGTFRHPNVFGGYLSIILFWIFSYVVLFKDSNYFKIVFILGFISLFLTFSLTSLIAILFSIWAFRVIKRHGKRGVLLSLLITFILFGVGLFVPYVSRTTYFQDDPSFYRRSNLLKSAYSMVDESILFGKGLNNFTVVSSNYLPNTQVLVFNQPVHNIFVLVLAESGIFSFILFVSLLYLAIRNTLENSFGLPAVLFISILALIIMGSFDHFFYTIHQTSILYWLTLGLALTYTKEDVEV